MTWFHGGRPGLRPGTWLQPPVVTGTKSMAQYGIDMVGVNPWEHGMEADRHRDDVVYLASHRALARLHANAWGLTLRGTHGSIYAAIPVGPEPDPDLEPDFPGLSVQCPFALIVAVVEPVVRLSVRQHERLTLRFMTWQYGICPVCGHDGASPGCDCESCPCWPERLGVPWRRIAG